MQNDDIKLTFGKYAGRRLSETPTEYQTWLSSQVWFRVKFMNTGESLGEDTPFHKRLSSKGLGILREQIKSGK